MHYYLDTLSEIKLQYFTDEEVDGLEPKCGTVNVAEGTANGIGHLFAATICHSGPSPGFTAPWTYKYITHELQDVLKELLLVLSPGSLYCDTYREVRGIFHRSFLTILSKYKVPGTS